MQASTAANQGRVFTRMNKLLFVSVLFGLMAWSSSCDDNSPNGQVFIPDVPVNITINTDLPLHFHLKNPGQYSYLDGGNRGVLLIHNFDDQFYALERTCTFESDLSCAVIHVDSTNFQLRCGQYTDGKWASCCASKYAFDGNVLEAPARFPLRQYAVLVNGSLITIRN